MRSRRAAAEHQEAVSRRLALLSAELATARPAPPAKDPATPTTEPAWWEDHTRVRPRVAPAAPPPSPPPPPPPSSPPPATVTSWTPPPVPVPGRHAARRRRPALAVVDVVPPTLRGRAAMGSAQLAVVSVVVALGLAATCWWVVRGDADPVAPLPVDSSPVADLVELPEPAVPVAAASPGAGPTPPGAGEAAQVVVDVAGEVRRPGIVVLDAGARVVDAVAAAGGARRGVDLSGLNLARLLVDGEQVLVGARAAGQPPLPGSVGQPGGAAPALVNLNVAAVAELETLPEVGPVTAAAIIAWREEHGGFTAVEELLEVDGIGDATLAQIAPHVTV